MLGKRSLRGRRARPVPTPRAIGLELVPRRSWLPGPEWDHLRGLGVVFVVEAVRYLDEYVQEL